MTIIQSELNSEIPKEAESDEEEPNTLHLTWCEAAAALDTFIQFAEGNSHYNTAEIMNLHILRQDCFAKRATVKKQIDIRELFKWATGDNNHGKPCSLTS